MSHRSRLAMVAFYSVIIGAMALFLFVVATARYVSQRGIWLPGDPLPPATGAASPLGSTVELEQYRDPAELGSVLDTAESMGLVWLRQELPWDEVEPEQGQYNWEPWDRIIQEVSDRGFRLILVLNRTPGWARQQVEQDNPLAPPASTHDFVVFARAAAARYGDRVTAWQIWDEPNIMPHWGTEVILDPLEYANFLAAASPAIRAADPDAVVVTAGLAPTGEPGGFNMSEVRFLEGLYRAGADPYFDAVALKAYGFWGEVAERIFAEEQLNFDRSVLVREAMVHNGDGQTPIWLVEGGWATLPPDWQGDPPPWGSDRPFVQRSRVERGIKRAALEWPWVQVIALQPLQPDVSSTDPRRGLALLDESGDLTALGEGTARMGTQFFNGSLGEEIRQEWENGERRSLERFDTALWVTGGLLALLVARASWHIIVLPWGLWGQWFRARPQPIQGAAFLTLVALFYWTDSLALVLLLYAALGVIIGWRPDLGLAAVAFAIPFFLQVKHIGGLQFSMVELLLLLCALVWFLRALAQARQHPDGAKAGTHEALRTLFWPRSSLDWALVLFVIWAAASISWAQRADVAAREFRVVVVESVLFYWLIRRAGLTEPQRRRLLDALVVAATLIALFGLYQWLFTSDIITAEGVRRIRGVYGSPNNLALLLARVLPILAAVALITPSSRRRTLYTIAAIPVSVCLFLTFSRGAWLLGMPAALLWLAWWGGKRARVAVGAAVAVAVLLLLPFASTERIASTTNLEGGTWFIRMLLWESTLAMLRDYPLLGVGLDNFLYTYDSYRLPEAWREPDLSHPHQILLHFWVALGLPGLVFLLWQQGAFWQSWASRIKRLPRGTMAQGLLIGLGASMIATLAHGMIDNSYFNVDLAFIWMMTLAIVHDLERARDATPPDPRTVRYTGRDNRAGELELPPG